MDYYKILEVNKKATIEEIKKSYKRLVAKYHPDRNSDDETAIEKFKQVTEAYEVLSDDKKRREYDQFGHVRSRGKFSNPQSDFFDSFFNRARRRHNVGHPISVRREVDLSFVLKGGRIVVKYTRHKICESCNGVGGDLTICPTCQGTGLKTVRHPMGVLLQTSCDSCGGVGKVISKECSNCKDGLGDEYEEEVVVDIPEGIESGSKFQVPEGGEPGPEGYGMLLITIIVKEHELFTRLSNGNLLTKVPVTFTQLIKGCSLEVLTLDGVGKIKIPAGTRSGTKFRLKTKGLPVINRSWSLNNRGDMIVEIFLDTPNKTNYQEIIDSLVDLEERHPSSKILEYKKQIENHGKTSRK